MQYGLYFWTRPRVLRPKLSPENALEARLQGRDPGDMVQVYTRFFLHEDLIKILSDFGSRTTSSENITLLQLKMACPRGILKNSKPASCYSHAGIQNQTSQNVEIH
jgi:hypothetical protein